MGDVTMKTATLFGIAAMGMAALGATNAFATPVLQVTVGSNTVTPTALSLGSGAYYFAASSAPLGGFSWSGVLVQTNAATNQFTLGLTGVTNGNTGNSNATISFIAEESITDPNAQSMQAAGTAVATGATSAQTVDFNSAIASSIPSSLGFQDSGSLGLNSVGSPTSPSSSVAYSSPGTNLGAFSGQLTVINTIALTINPSTAINPTTLVTNISDSTIPVPEPAALALFAVGGLTLLAAGRRNKARS